MSCLTVYPVWRIKGAACFSGRGGNFTILQICIIRGFPSNGIGQYFPHNRGSIYAPNKKLSKACGSWSTQVPKKSIVIGDVNVNLSLH